MIYIGRPPRPEIKVYHATTSLENRKKGDLSDTVLAKLKALEVGQSELLKRLHQPNAKFSRADWETLKAIGFYSNKDNFENNFQKIKKGRTPPKFKIYSNDELKQHLEALFNGKCAYCESNFLPTSNADIEHFRPKRAINRFENNSDTKPTYPGYYWLGAEWNNLFWSCQLCNRTNRLFVINERRKLLVGKFNRFPIYGGEHNRIRNHSKNIEKEDEYCLFINPTKDNPDDYLVYLENGTIDVKVKQGFKYEKAIASINGYGLLRGELVKEREQILIQLREILIDLGKAIIAFLDKVDASLDIKEEEETLNRKLNSLKSFFAKRRPYIAAKVALFKSFPSADFSQWEERTRMSRMDLIKTSN